MKTLRCYFGRRSYSASSRNAKISSRKKIQAKHLMDQTQAQHPVVKKNQSRATVSSRKKSRRKELKKKQSAAGRQKPAKVKDASTFTLQRSVAPKWKEDKIAFWSAEEFWKLSNGKNFTEAIYWRRRPLKKCSSSGVNETLCVRSVDEATVHPGATQSIQSQEDSGEAFDDPVASNSSIQSRAHMNQLLLYIFSRKLCIQSTWIPRRKESKISAEDDPVAVLNQ
ncbi:hypothetical protein F511_28099 [Dorcoceras hygrometricum]|uniref:Uncharacterized protein n=1 Tax=Dorcoceras hygrometricum TaxID=472368 RepID=A0A2Z7D3T8_9LAMI|nr:hypothetical protein F511_28099 [Dorcoceras hygrometricum]